MTRLQAKRKPARMPAGPRGNQNQRAITAYQLHAMLDHTTNDDALTVEASQTECLDISYSKKDSCCGRKPSVQRRL